MPLTVSLQQVMQLTVPVATHSTPVHSRPVSSVIHPPSGTLSSLEISPCPPDDFSLLSLGSTDSDAESVNSDISFSSPPSPDCGVVPAAISTELVTSSFPTTEPGWVGFTLVGDNIDKSVKPREMREDHQNRILSLLCCARSAQPISSF